MKHFNNNSIENSTSLSFYYGDELISFERRPRADKTAKVLIKVKPDGKIQVLASEQVDNMEVLNAVKKRSRWIYKQLSYFRQQYNTITPRKYISSESHYYLGKQYLLKVIEIPSCQPTIKLFRGKLQVTVPYKTTDNIQKLLNKWYKTRAKIIFAKRLAELLPQTLWVTQTPPFQLLTMQTQWGSCSPRGRLTLNPLLVKTPRECIDYVILHELCHLAEHNHSEQFYRLMKQVMPDWEKVKDRLDAMAIMVLNT